jgi:subfamily B ATP-binding cassette protein MsbA
MRVFLSRLYELVKPYRFRLFLGVLLGVLAGLVEPLLMASAKVVIDALFPTAGGVSVVQLPQWAPEFLRAWAARLNAHLSNAHTVQSMKWVVALIPMVMFLRSTLGYLNNYYLQWVAVRAVTDLRVRLFTHLFSLPMSFFHKTSTGELMSRVLHDVMSLQGTLSSTTVAVIKDPVTLASLLAFLLWQNPRVTLVLLLTVPVCVVPIATFSRKARHSAVAISKDAVAIAKVMHESFSGARIIKAYNLEEHVVKQFASSSRLLVSNHMRLTRASETPGPLIEFMGAVGVAGFLLYATGATGAVATPGEMLMIVGSIFSMYRPIKSLTRLHSNLEAARAASERVFQLLATRSEILEPISPKPLKAAGANIDFEHVSFSYGEKPTVADITLTVPAGKLVALVGASGSGKTTLTNLLLRFYDPQQGAVRIGGTDIREVRSQELRDQIAVVTQETILFNDTIRNNIALGRAGASEEEIVAAAKHAHAHGFILEKPHGYDTQIGEKGVALSGGQRQRLAIARAILKDAPILVLDEATSALDTESERAVQEALDELMIGRTTICIAHRLSTIQRADVIVVMDQGRIVETGTHAELIARGGIYRKLHDLQFNA